MQPAISVIGIGNPLRHDDAIGLILLDFLRENKKDFPSAISFFDGGTGGMNLLHLLTDSSIVLIIDAVQFGGNPGSWRFFSYDEVINTASSSNISTHISNIFEVVLIAKNLDKKPDYLYVFGVEPQDLSLGEGLSQSIQNNMSLIKKALKEKINWMSSTFNRD